MSPYNSYSRPRVRNLGASPYCRLMTIVKISFCDAFLYLHDVVSLLSFSGFVVAG